MTSSPVFLRLMSNSIAVANHAGKMIREIMSKGELGIVEKGEDDLQTEADRIVQQIIIGNLSKNFPKIKIIGEEDQTQEASVDMITDTNIAEILELNCPQELADIKEEDLVVWVDPLDGTAEYILGKFAVVSVLIGISHKDRAIGGVIHQPYYNFRSINSGTAGRTIWGIPGVGVGGFQPRPPSENKRVLVTAMGPGTPVVKQALEALKPDEIRRVGGTGYKVLLLMEGQATAFVLATPGCMKWDTCAPEAILSATGGRLTDIHGNLYSYGSDVEHPNNRGILATAKATDHQWLVDTIPDAVKQIFH